MHFVFAFFFYFQIWAASSEFVSSSIPSWQILTAHAQQFRRARDLVFCLKVPLASLLVWASSEGSGETARMRRLAWTFAARIGDKYQIRLTRSIYWSLILVYFHLFIFKYVDRSFLEDSLYLNYRSALFHLFIYRKLKSLIINLLDLRCGAWDN